MQDLMMFRCISQFDIDTPDLKGESDEEEEPTTEERQLAALKREASLSQYTPVPISDNEEEDNFDLSVAHTPSQPSQRVLG
jgi:hypothetical protein